MPSTPERPPCVAARSQSAHFGTPEEREMPANLRFSGGCVPACKLLRLRACATLPVHRSVHRSSPFQCSPRVSPSAAVWVASTRDPAAAKVRRARAPGRAAGAAPADRAEDRAVRAAEAPADRAAGASRAARAAGGPPGIPIAPSSPSPILRRCARTERPWGASTWCPITSASSSFRAPRR